MYYRRFNFSTILIYTFFLNLTEKENIDTIVVELHKNMIFGYINPYVFSDSNLYSIAVTIIRTHC